MHQVPPLMMEKKPMPVHFTPDQLPPPYLQTEEGWTAPAVYLPALLDLLQALEPEIATLPPLARLWAAELRQALEEANCGEACRHDPN